jgi:hypothetical protein
MPVPRPSARRPGPPPLQHEDTEQAGRGAGAARPVRAGLGRQRRKALARDLHEATVGEALSEDEPDHALDAFEAAVAAASEARAPFFEAIARTADVALRGRYGDPIEAFDRYRAALEIWSATGADGMAVTTLRNLVVLLARTGADADSLALHHALERLASRRSYGPEADRLHTALTSVLERLSVADRGRAEEHATSVVDVAEAIRFGLASIGRAAPR